MKKILPIIIVLFVAIFNYIYNSGGEQNEIAKNAPIVQKNENFKTPKNQNEEQSKVKNISKNGSYTSKDEVASYIFNFQTLPQNYITKKEAMKLGWKSKSYDLWDVAPGKSIGGDRFGNYENRLPNKSGRTWKECDIDYKGGNRNAKRIVFSNDGLVYYTNDHYNSFEKIDRIK